MRTKNFNFIPVKRNSRHCIGYKKRFLVFIRVSLDAVSAMESAVKATKNKTTKIDCNNEIAYIF